jgi:hypothetical protein
MMNLQLGTYTIALTAAGIHGNAFENIALHSLELESELLSKKM